MKLCRVFAIAALALATASTAAQAVVLPPDGTPVILGPAIAPPPFTTVASTNLGILSSGAGPMLNGTLTSTVYRLTADVTEGGVTYAKGDLVFGYTVSLNKGSANLTALAVSGFNQAAGPYDAELDKPGKGGPYAASYDGNGGTITGLYALKAGQKSSELLIFTTDTKYTQSFASVAGGIGTSESNLKVYTPFTATPEPGTIALACAGLPVLGLYHIRRRRRATNA